MQGVTLPIRSARKGSALERHYHAGEGVFAGSSGPKRGDLVAALDLVRRVAAAGDRILRVDASMGRPFATRLACIVRALETDRLATVRRAPDGRPSGAALTDFGICIGERLRAGDVALLPAKGDIKVVAAPRAVPPHASADWLDRAIADRGPVLVLVSAPAHYGEDVVEGSATEVIFDRLDS